MRRAKGSGSIFKRKDGYYVCKFGGKTAYAKTAMEAQDKLDDLRIKIAEARDRAKKDFLMKDALEIWLNGKRLSLKNTSLDRLESTVRKHILPKVGYIKCSEFSENDFIEKILVPMQIQGLSFSSCKKAQDAMCNFCTWASASSRHIIPTNPLSSYERIRDNSSLSLEPDLDDENESVVFIEQEGREKFCAVCRAKKSNGRPYYIYGQHFIFMMYTGLRLGEMLALQWNDVDFNKRIITIRNTASLVKERDPQSESFGKSVLKVFPRVKNNKVRVIPLGNIAFEAISAIRKSSRSNAVYVCESSAKKIVYPGVFQKMLARIFDISDIQIQKGTNVHALRHTFASMCFAAGMQVKVVSELLGHSSVKITMDLYIHLISDRNLETMPELANLR